MSGFFAADGPICLICRRCVRGTGSLAGINKLTAEYFGTAADRKSSESCSKSRLLAEDWAFGEAVSLQVGLQAWEINAHVV